MDYLKDIRIDESALDVEWLDQPSLMFQYAKREAQGKRALDVAESVFELAKSELDTEIRKDPVKFGIPETVKITEAVIRNALIQLKDYQEIEISLFNAREEYAIAKAATKAIDARKSALENLVKLYGQSYFAGPSIPRDISKEWEKAEKEKRQNRNISNSMPKKEEESTRQTRRRN